MNDNSKAHCDAHGAHCVQIERLERDICVQKNELKDARKSLTHDMERRDGLLLQSTKNVMEHNEKTYVTKHEFEPIKKLVYGTALLMIAEVVRRIML